MGVIRSAVRAAKAAMSALRQPGGMIYTGGRQTESGVFVSEDTAMRFATVHACVRVLSEDVAALPMHVYRRTGDGKRERDTGNPLYELLHDRPNPEMNSIDFRGAMMLGALLTGNGYAFIEFDRRGRVRALYPLLASEVSVYRNSLSEVRYKAGGEDLSAGEMFHLRGLGFDGLVGLSPIAYARESIGLGQAAEIYGEKFFRNGTHIGGVISMEGELTNEQFERVRAQFRDAFRGLQNAHGVPVLEGGAKYTPVGIAPEDAQFLETRKFQRSEIAAIYRVPPHMIGDLERATFSNIEQQDQAYLQRSLVPWLVRWEKEARAKLVPEAERGKIYIEHDTAGFMRGETLTRFQAYSAAIMAGIMTPNEARERENLNPMEGGDRILLPLNMQQGSGAPRDEGQRMAELLRRDFTTDGGRRAVGGGNIAAQLAWLGVRREDFEALEAGFRAWLKQQAEDLLAMAEGEGYRSRGPSAAALARKVEAYYEDLAKKGAQALAADAGEGKQFPGWADVNQATEKIAGSAWRRIAGELGEEAAPSEKWVKGYLNRYREDMSLRLCRANRDEILKLIRREDGSPDGDMMGAMRGMLGHWYQDMDGTSRAAAMARMEAAFMHNEALVAGYRQAGYESIWKSAPGCCALCNKLNGQTVTTLKPPLHKGCGCTVVRGDRRPGEGLKEEPEAVIIDATEDGRPTKKKVQGFTVEIKYGKHNVKPTYKPSAIIDVVSDQGGTMRYVYDKSGKLRGHIDNNDHGYPKRHPFKNHEHFHKAKWIEGQFAGFEDAEELTEYQRKMNADILKKE